MLSSTLTFFSLVFLPGVGWVPFRSSATFGCVFFPPSPSLPIASSGWMASEEAAEGKEIIIPTGDDEDVDYSDSSNATGVESKEARPSSAAGLLSPSSGGAGAAVGNHLDDDTSWSKTSAVVVAVRVRPYQGRELRDNNTRMIIEMNGNSTTIYDPSTLDEPDPAKRKKKVFTFDHSYYSFCERKDADSNVKGEKADEINARRYKLPGAAAPKFCTQEQVFNDIGRGILANAMRGFNCSLLGTLCIVSPLHSSTRLRSLSELSSHLESDLLNDCFFPVSPLLPCVRALVPVFFLSFLQRTGRPAPASPTR